MYVCVCEREIFPVYKEWISFLIKKKEIFSGTSFEFFNQHTSRGKVISNLVLK